jgi:hypothetical protein
MHGFGQLAEGEELGSNLLRVAHGSRGYSGGSMRTGGGPTLNPVSPLGRPRGLLKAIQPAGRECGHTRFGAIARPRATSKPSPFIP